MSDKNFETQVNVNTPKNPSCECSAPAEESTKATRIPRADIYQNGEDVILELDMPGVSKENVDIQLEGDVLTLTGKIAEIPSQWSLIHCESVQRDYQRAFELGPDVDTDNIKAQMKAGVLSVTLPKVQTAKARKIAVSA